VSDIHCVEISYDEKYDFASVFSKHMDEKFSKRVSFDEANFKAFQTIYTFLKPQETSVGLTFLSLGVPTAFFTMKALNDLTGTEILQEDINLEFYKALLQAAIFLIGPENVSTKENFIQALKSGDFEDLPDFNTLELDIEKFQQEVFNLNLKPQVII